MVIWGILVMRNIKVRNKRLIVKGGINSLNIYLFKMVFTFILRENILISVMCQEDVHDMPLALDQIYQFDRLTAIMLTETFQLTAKQQ